MTTDGAPRPQRPWARLRPRLTLLSMLAVGGGFLAFFVFWVQRTPRELSCEHLCRSAGSHCVFTDRAPCFARCASDDASCRHACVEASPSCDAHCGSVRARGCEAQLQALYGCVILRCAAPDTDLWQACDGARTRYERCLQRP